MSSSTYTREYLQNLPSETRKQWIKSLYLDHSHGGNVIAKVTEKAKEGETSVTIPLFNSLTPKNFIDCGSNLTRPHWAKNQITPEEVISILQEIFPDSKITYEEKWLQISPDKQELKKGICIDWS
jgi:hypothetical protein